MSHVMTKSDTLKHRDTKFMLWKWPIWSFNQLMAGVVAEKKPNDVSQPDAGCSLFGTSGYRGVLFITAADLDEYHKAYYISWKLMGRNRGVLKMVAVSQVYATEEMYTCICICICMFKYMYTYIYIFFYASIYAYTM